MAKFKVKDKAPTGFLKFLLAGVVLAVMIALYAISFGVISQVISQLGFSSALDDMFMLSLISDFLLAVFVCLGISMLGGSYILRLSGKKVGQAFKTCAYIVIVSLGFAAFDLVTAFFSAETYTVFAPGWQRTLIIVFFMCLFIGIAEEAVFRGVILHGLLALGGRGKKSVLFCVILSSLLFGVAHVITDFQGLATADVNYIAQMVLKTLQTTFVGMALAAATLRTRNIIGPAIVHGTFDFVSLFMYAVVFGGSSEALGEYVVTGAEASAAVVQYVVMCVIFLPAAIIAIRQILKGKMPDRGAFYRYVVRDASGPNAFYPYGYKAPAAAVAAAAAGAAAGAVGQPAAAWGQQGAAWGQPADQVPSIPMGQPQQAQQPWQPQQHSQETWQQHVQANQARIMEGQPGQPQQPAQTQVWGQQPQQVQPQQQAWGQQPVQFQQPQQQAWGQQPVQFQQPQQQAWPQQPQPQAQQPQQAWPQPQPQQAQPQVQPQAQQAWAQPQQDVTPTEPVQPQQPAQPQPEPPAQDATGQAEAPGQQE